MDNNFLYGTGSVSDDQVSDELQAKMNQPPVDPNGFSPNTEAFLRDVMSQVSSGEINVFSPSSLLNQNVYDSVTEEIQGKADLLAVSFCATIRQIQDLINMAGGDQAYMQPTYQLNALVREFRYKKEQFEEQYGDLFKI